LHGIAAEVEMVEADLRDAEGICGAVEGADAVFHLAAQTIVGKAQESPRDTFEVNVLGTWNVIEACREHGVGRVVFASSDKAYGASDELPYREDFPLRAAHTYDASKAAADILTRSYWPSYGLPVAVTRFANLYGGGDLNFSRLIPEAVSAVLEHRRPVIRSDGTPQRDFLYVEDAARAYLAIADALDEGQARGQAFNAGGGEPHSVADVLGLIAELAGSELELEIRGTGNPDGEIDRQYVDSTKLRELTGWRPEIDLPEGLRRTIEWYRDHPEARAPAA
jgi:CDP-glucose 4,6-dehydratase